MLYICSFLFRVAMVLLYYLFIPPTIIVYALIFFKFPKKGFFDNDWSPDGIFSFKHTYYKNTWRYLIDRKSCKVRLYGYSTDPVRYSVPPSLLPAETIFILNIHFKKNVKEKDIPDY